MSNKEISFLQKVANLRDSLNVPKNSYSDYGKFKYRSLPDIFEALTPALKKNGLSIEIIDEYSPAHNCMKSVSRLYDSGGEEVKGVGYAIIGSKGEKSKMNAAQEMGAASTYARKYSLEALLLLSDDNCSDSIASASSNASKATTYYRESVGSKRK